MATVLIQPSSMDSINALRAAGIRSRNFCRVRLNGTCTQ